MAFLSEPDKKPAPFQAIRIHKLLIGFALGHLIIVPWVICLSLAWIFYFDDAVQDAHFQVCFEFYAHLSYGLVVWLCWRALRRQGLPLQAFLGPAPTISPVLFVGLTLMLVISSFGLALPGDLLQMANGEPFNHGLPELWADGDRLAISYNLLTVLSGVFWAPLAEELCFRGIFLHRLTVKWNLREAIILSSLIFGLLHGLSIGAVVFGLVMSLVYLESGSLRLTICLHAIHNALIYLLAWLSVTGQLPLMESGVMLQFEVMCLALGGTALWYWFYVREHAWNRYPPFIQPLIQPVIQAVEIPAE